MLVTLLRIVTLVRLVQSAERLVPMLVTLLGIVTLVRLVQSIERLVPDAGDAVRNRDAGQTRASERIRPDGGDCQAVDIGWNGHNPGRPGVSDDGGTTVGVCAVSVDAAIGVSDEKGCGNCDNNNLAIASAGSSGLAMPEISVRIAMADESMIEPPPPPPLLRPEPPPPPPL